jgi:hypothetical protein
MTRHYRHQRRSECNRPGEPESHVRARLKTAQVLMSYDFVCDFGENAEGYRIPAILPPLDRIKGYKIDIVAVKNYKPYRIAGIGFPLVKLVEIDGGYHRSSKTNIGKTKVKHGQILECIHHELYHLDPEDVLSQDINWIAEQLGLHCVSLNDNDKIP